MQEKEKFNKTVEKLQRDMSELQAQLFEEGQKSIRVQMELASKDSEVEQLHQRLLLNASDSASVHSGNDLDGEDGLYGKEPTNSAHNSIPISCFMLWMYMYVTQR